VAQVLPLHALTVLAFIVLGGFLASLNHTRFDVKAPGPLDILYQVRVWVLWVFVKAASVCMWSKGGKTRSNFIYFHVARPLAPTESPQVKYHDIHHWFPESNYGQYIMLWDRLMGSFKPYPDTGSRSSSKSE
jgi:sterol desaturase/sphingolipid hydroxylase (fatty acid hydroxylase superfamily)